MPTAWRKSTPVIMETKCAVKLCAKASMMQHLGMVQAHIFASQAAAVQKIADFNARNVRAIAAFHAEASRRETQRLIGRQRADLWCVGCRYQLRLSPGRSRGDC